MTNQAPSVDQIWEQHAYVWGPLSDEQKQDVIEDVASWAADEFDLGYHTLLDAAGLKKAPPDVEQQMLAQRSQMMWDILAKLDPRMEHADELRFRDLVQRAVNKHLPEQAGAAPGAGGPPVNAPGAAPASLQFAPPAQPTPTPTSIWPQGQAKGTLRYAQKLATP